MADPKAAAQKAVEESMAKIANLDAREKVINYDARCTYDVGTHTPYPSGPNGKYVKQCLRYAIFDIDPPFCYQHAKKSLLIDVIKNKSEFFRLDGKKMLTSSGAEMGIYDPGNIKISLDEYTEYINGAGKKAVCDLIIPANEGGVFGRKAAICKAFTPSPNMK